ncbi:hypothetical protein R3W88_012563 [Solanum pinnatisectum]|uniref:Phosphofructokinase domain-containing protein n=1 Tax=Solanum pinnatisectum TaxID=50273 RepID=A0AAV9LD08_9SOLN|nr:hypothetical protein R3W88_012563 [Solanum pinnatisectum]
MGSLDDSIVVHNLNKKIMMGDDGYVLKDVPHLSDYIPSLPTYPNPLKNNPSYSVNSPRGTHFCRAGPCQNVYFKSDDVNSCIVTCGGLNTVIREIVCGLYSMYVVTRVMGIDGGYQGFYSKNTIPLTPKVVNDIEEVYIFGGDRTQKRASMLFEEITRRGLNVVVVGIPKTTDNDMPIIDKSFDFDSLVEEAQHVDCCLIPESGYYLEGCGGVFEYIEQRQKENGHMVIVVAESAGQDDEQVDVDPTYMIRAIASNASDNVYCTLLAHSVVYGAMAGCTGFTVGPVNNTHAYIPFDRIIEKQNKVDITDMIFLSTTRSVDIIEANKDEEPPIQLTDGETNSC